MDPLGASPLPPRRASEWANALGGSLQGPDAELRFACTLEAGSEGGISFIANASYRRAWAKTAASVVLASPSETVPEGFAGSVLRVANPYAAWAAVLSSGQKTVAWASSRSAGVDPSAIIHPGVHLADDVVVGARTVLHPGVVLYPGSEVGSDCILHANVVLGADGFGFVPPHGTAMTQGFHSFDHPVRIDSFQPHGHLRMRAASLEIYYPATGRTEQISQISNWSATWHHSHLYEPDVAPLVPTGAVLVIKQWYDNTANNPNNPDPDFWVVAGSRTADEMTHAWIAITHLDDAGYDEILAQRQVAKQRSVAGQ